MTPTRICNFNIMAVWKKEEARRGGMLAHVEKELFVWRFGVFSAFTFLCYLLCIWRLHGFFYLLFLTNIGSFCFARHLVARI